MPTEAADYGVLIATLLAISLAGERVVAIVKTMIPGWFAEPSATPGAPARGIADDQWRRLRVQAVAFAACWAAAASLHPGGFNALGTLTLGGITLWTPLVGLLTMGGSAFWSQVLGISSAFKDLKNAQTEQLRSAPAAPPAPAPDGTVRLRGMEIAKAGAGS